MAMNKKDTEVVREIKRHMNVLMEDMIGQVKIVAEQHGSIVSKLEEHDARFEAIDRRFESIDRRFNKIDLSLERIEIDIKAITTGLFDTSHRVDDHEARIRKLELGFQN